MGLALIRLEAHRRAAAGEQKAAIRAEVDRVLDGRLQIVEVLLIEQLLRQQGEPRADL